MADGPLVDGIENILYSLIKVGEICGGLKEVGKMSAEVVENSSFLKAMDTLWACYSRLSKSEGSLRRLESWAFSARSMFPCADFDKHHDLMF